MTTHAPVHLRWRSAGAAPGSKTVPDLDAVEARWETLQHQAPQMLDARRILLISTKQLKAAMVEGNEPEPG